MDKGKIKSFAVWARRAMIQAVKDRAFRVGVEKNKIQKIEILQGGFKVKGREEIFNISPSHREKLVELIKEKGYEQVVEEVAYTWFNRFMALRYMEVNEYLPTGVRILSSEEDGKKEPDVLSKISEIAEDLSLNLDYVYELQDKNTEQAREILYKYILVRQCNELGNIIPQMFEKIEDYTELLLPDNLLHEGSVIRKMCEDIEEENWKEEVEIIGWMYQYYISEKKDEVFEALKKNVKITKENIPAATQLFTPKWIVKYMVENSLGRLWLEGHPNEELQKEWKYYLEEAEQEPEVELELQKIREEHSKLKPEDIKVLDPCMGSGHILVYAFDVLYKIYKTAGYSEREIPRLILKNNLYGLDIDYRAAQLASFALIMKARHYNRRLFREIEKDHLELNLCSIEEGNGISKEAIDYFASGNQKVREDVGYLINVFEDAKEYGSILEVDSINIELINERLKKLFREEKQEVNDQRGLLFGDYRKLLIKKIPLLLKQCMIMSRKYDVCITNPPYMGAKGMGVKLARYAKEYYDNSKSDLCIMFIERCEKYTKKNMYSAMITMHSWMFLNSFEKLRKKIIENISIVNLVHLGTRAFSEIGGEVVQTASWVIRNKERSNKGKYIRLVNYNSSNLKEKEFFNKRNYYFVDKTHFSKIPSMPIAYWATKNDLHAFETGIKLGNIADVKVGLQTGDNNRFLRFWFEVIVDKISMFNNKKECKWYPYNKGGEFRKWYGNSEYLINWENDGDEIKKHKGSVIRSPQYYFKESLSWSKVAIGSFSVRYFPKGFLYDVAGCSIFTDNENRLYFLGLLNSKVASRILSFLSQTVNYEVGNISSIPIINKNDCDIKDLVNKSKSLAMNDWNNFESSWDFKVHPLLKLLNKCEQYKLESVFLIWDTECEDSFEQLKYNEEELNRIFIDIYGLQDELTPEVEDKDITIRKADREREIKSFISYAIGCIFGRYSIDVEGLIYAGGSFNDKWKFENGKTLVRDIQKVEDGEVISDNWVETRFSPDIDNIIPITEDEYFEDDIVSRFIEFVRIVYGDEYLEENLDFIADSIGKKSTETYRQAIRRYFIKDFYKDHLKIYQKRPIYWMFDSGKNDGFKALIYMHRYDESTVAKLRTDYLHSLQRKYEAEIVRHQQLSESTLLSAREKTAAKKKIDRINKQLEECKLYDQVVAHVANERISIDLDDGVKHNYALFQGVKVPIDSGKEVKMDLLAKI